MTAGFGVIHANMFWLQMAVAKMITALKMPSRVSDNWCFNTHKLQNEMATSKYNIKTNIGWLSKFYLVNRYT